MHNLQSLRPFGLRSLLGNSWQMPRGLGKFSNLARLVKHINVISKHSRITNTIDSFHLSLRPNFRFNFQSSIVFDAHLHQIAALLTFKCKTSTLQYQSQVHSQTRILQKDKIHGCALDSESAPEIHNQDISHVGIR